MPERDVRVRLNDFYEVYQPADPDVAQKEGGRCMNCGAAFCMPDSGYGQGCPIYNKIPEWNELVRLGRWEDAYRRLSETNPFPEFTARVCPAPCQDACILGINERPIQIKGIERAIIDRAFAADWVKPKTPPSRNGMRVSVVGSGPAGLSAAHALNAAGYTVTVYERSDRPGGLLRYGVPNMKLDKRVLDRRVQLMIDSGIRFELDCTVGVDLSSTKLRAESDAIVLACGALQSRDLDLPGRGLLGIHQAIPYLTSAMQARDAGTVPQIDAEGKHVVVIGAGDTGADCIATALRQGAVSVINLARDQRPPEERDLEHSWPGPTGTVRQDYAHKEALTRHGEDPRIWRTETHAFIPAKGQENRVGAVEILVGENAMRQIDADLVILAIGFTGHDATPLLSRLGMASANERTQRIPPVFVAGDMATGPSLVVHAIAEGKRVAKQVQAELGDCVPVVAAH